MDSGGGCEIPCPASQIRRLPRCGPSPRPDEVAAAALRLAARGVQVFLERPCPWVSGIGAVRAAIYTSGTSTVLPPSLGCLPDDPHGGGHCPDPGRSDYQGLPCLPSRRTQSLLFDFRAGPELQNFVCPFTVCSMCRRKRFLFLKFSLFLEK